MPSVGAGIEFAAGRFAAVTRVWRTPDRWTGDLRNRNRVELGEQVAAGSWQETSAVHPLGGEVAGWEGLAPDRDGRTERGLCCSVHGVC